MHTFKLDRGQFNRGKFDRGKFKSFLENVTPRIRNHLFL